MRVQWSQPRRPYAHANHPKPQPANPQNNTHKRTHRELVPEGEVVDLVGDVELEEGEHDEVRHVERPGVPQLLPRREVHVAALLP